MSDTIDWVALAYEAGVARIWGFSGPNVVSETTRAVSSPNAGVADLIGDFCDGATCPVLTCGLQGQPFRALPCNPLDDVIRTAQHGSLSQAQIDGLAQGSPACVAQTATLKIAGFLSLNPQFDGVLCLPGPETLWALISAEEVISMQSFMTADIARDTAARLGLHVEAWDDSAFAEAISDSMAKPERIAARLSQIGAEARISGLSENIARARVWGHLIGAELAAARSYWLGQQVAVIYDAPILGCYTTGLTAQGVSPIAAKGEEMLLKGFQEARKRVSA